MADDTPIEIQTPGDTGSDASFAADQATQLADLQAENAQLKAMISDLQEQLRAVQTVPAVQPQVDRGVRRVGADWSRMTAAEAQAAGCTERVLCADGYFIPG